MIIFYTVNTEVFSETGRWSKVILTIKIDNFTASSLVYNPVYT